jgi:MHS family proline/betaine transporter-like MFS transporter
MPTFAIRHLNLERADALWSNAAGLLVLIIVAPVTGYFSDRFGRRPFLIGSCLAVAAAVYPVFSYLLENPSLLSLVIAQMLFGILIALYSGPGPAAIAELFDTEKRATGMSIGYSLAVAMFGGFAPFIATWLIDVTGSPLSPAFYVLAASLLTGIVILRFPETAHRPLK